MPQQNQPQQPGQDPAGTEGDALDELENALGTDPDPAEGGGETDEWTPPTREQWEAAQAALEAEKAKLARARKQAQRLREGGKGTGQQQPAGAEDGDSATGQPTGPDPQLAVWQARAVRTTAKAALLERGADPELVDLALARLRPAEIEFTEDDEPDLDAFLDETQERFPKMFAKPEPQQPGRRPAGTVDQGRGTGRPVGRQMSYGERVLENSQRAMRGGRRGTP